MSFFRPILAIARKDLLLLLRDRINFFFTFFFPMIIGLFFGVIFAGGGSLPTIRVGVVDLDGSPASRAMAADLAATDGLSVQLIDAGGAPPDPAAAAARVRRGELAAVITLPKGFGAGMKSMLRGRGLAIEGVIDPTRKAQAGLLAGKLNELAFRQLSRVFEDPAQSREMIEGARADLRADREVDPVTRAAVEVLFSAIDGLARTNARRAGAARAGGAGNGFRPVEVQLKEVAADDRGPPHSFAITFPQAAVWGLLGCCVAFAVSLVQERSRGTLIRLLTAPVGRTQVMLAKALACFATAVTVQLLMMAIMAARVSPQSWTLLAVAVLCGAAAFTGIMMLLAVISKTEGGSAGVGRGALLLLAMFGGGSIPLQFMPDWMQAASSVSPFKWAILAMEGAIWRGYGASEMLLPCGVLLGFGAAGFGLGARVFRRTATSV
ncbi:MAG: ABC transporter permease [Phycisphaerales bacterium]|nr:ABC transporter permease [Phycisphaerales bacterium]